MVGRRSIKVGVLFCRGGAAGLWAPSAETSAILAASEINVAGGVLDKSIELVLRDVGQTEREAAEAAASLIEIDEVDALIGMHPSSTRDAVARVAAGRVPSIYTPQYEGGSTGLYTIAIGGTDERLLTPAIAWLMENRHASRFFLVGSDYVWPRTTHGTASRLITASGGTVVGAAIVPFGTEDYTDVIASLKRAGPHVVILSLLGSEASRFNRAFAAAGLGASCLRLALGQDETVIYATGPDNTENLFVASHYLASARTRGNARFLERYHDAFGEGAPPANAFGQSCYEGLYALADLARHAGRLDHASLLKGSAGRVPCRTVRHDGLEVPLGAPRAVFLAAADGMDLRVIQTA